MATKLIKAAAKFQRRSSMEIMIRNIIYNAEQDTSSYTVEELLRSMRKAIGVRADEKI